MNQLVADRLPVWKEKPGTEDRRAGRPLPPFEDSGLSPRSTQEAEAWKKVYGLIA